MPAFEAAEDDPAVALVRRQREAWVIGAGFLLLALVAVAAQQLSVQVRETALRQRPSYLAPATVWADDVEDDIEELFDRVDALELKGPATVEVLTDVELV